MPALRSEACGWEPEIALDVGLQGLYPSGKLRHLLHTAVYMILSLRYPYNRNRIGFLAHQRTHRCHQN